MIVIQNEEIRSLGLQPANFIECVRQCFIEKPQCQVPPKVSVHPNGIDFTTSMPCLLPPDTHRFSVKVVSRVQGRHPALRSDSMLYDVTTGELLAVIDSDYVTTMRTGAVAALAVSTLKRKGAKTIALMGLGNTGRAAMACLATALKGRGPYEVRLLRYKDQAERFAERFADLADFHFTFADNVHDLFDGADIILSCITQAEGLITDDTAAFKPGVLVVPVHTRGFQNCDTTFDRVFCDDVGHVSGFRYFHEFPSLTELGEVLRGEKPGRLDDSERIIDYNVGLGLHDAYICSMIYDTVASKPHEQIALVHPSDKYII